MSDLKAKRDAREQASCARPMLSLTQRNGLVHNSRGTGYGADKYARGNYFGPPPADVDPVDRFLGYIDAAMRHLTHVAQAINVAKGTGGDARAACAIVDEDASGGFPPSLLPHVSHAIAGLMIMVECGVTDGLLPADPGEPWKAHPMYAEVLARRATGKPPSTHYGKSDVEIRAGQGLPQKDDPDLERARVAALRHASRATLATINEAHRTGDFSKVGGHEPRGARHFKVGDVVKTTTGVDHGLMTVERLHPGMTIVCVWWGTTAFNRGEFQATSLRFATPEEIASAK